MGEVCRGSIMVFKYFYVSINLWANSCSLLRRSLLYSHGFYYSNWITELFSSSSDEDIYMKNIPIPPMHSYLKSLIENVKSVIKRMWWKAHLHGNNSDERIQPTHDADAETETDDKYGFKSRKYPPRHEDLDRFQADLMDMVNNIQFRRHKKNFKPG